MMNTELNTERSLDNLKVFLNSDWIQISSLLMCNQTTALLEASVSGINICVEKKASKIEQKTLGPWSSQKDLSAGITFLNRPELGEGHGYSHWPITVGKLISTDSAWSCARWPFSTKGTPNHWGNVCFFVKGNLEGTAHSARRPWAPRSDLAHHC